MVLVHGLGGTSQSLICMESTMKYLYPDILILSSKANEMEDSNPSEMGHKLAFEVIKFIETAQYEDFELSFIGHSLGGLLIRTALPHLERYKHFMKHCITMGCPHLGYDYHNSKLTKIGMWAIHKMYNSEVMKHLLM